MTKKGIFITRTYGVNSNAPTLEMIFFIQNVFPKNINSINLQEYGMVG